VHERAGNRRQDFFLSYSAEAEPGDEPGAPARCAGALPCSPCLHPARSFWNQRSNWLRGE